MPYSLYCIIWKFFSLTPFISVIIPPSLEGQDNDEIFKLGHHQALCAETSNVYIEGLNPSLSSLHFLFGLLWPLDKWRIGAHKPGG